MMRPGLLLTAVSLVQEIQGVVGEHEKGVFEEEVAFQCQLKNKHTKNSAQSCTPTRSKNHGNTAHKWGTKVGSNA